MVKPITIDSHGYKLSGKLFTANKPTKLAFLLIQGWKGHQNVEAAQALAELGYTCMTYDMRGNGDSEGDLAEFSRADFISDSLVAYDNLRQQVSANTAIGVIGSSFGSYTAVLLSAHRPVACLSLRVPASYPEEGFNDPQKPQSASEELTAWRNRPLNPDQNHAFKALQNFKGKVQIIEAEQDEMVPHQAPANYANSIEDKHMLSYSVIEGAPHRLVDDALKDKYIKLLTHWVDKELH